jgi:hypothetical protein
MLSQGFRVIALVNMVFPAVVFGIGKKNGAVGAIFFKLACRDD